MTPKEKKVVQDFLNNYYEKYKGGNERLPFKTQMQLLYDYLTHL